MRNDLLFQFDRSELPPHVAVLLEHAHAVARGAETAIRVARLAAVQRELGEPTEIANGAADELLALAGAASAMLGDRLESLSQLEHDQSRRLSGDK